MKSLIKWIKFKGWFIFDLPYFIRERNFRKGLKLSVESGRNFYFVSKINKSLTITSIDLCEPIESGPYKSRSTDEFTFKTRQSGFSKREELIKDQAKLIAENIPNEEFDFIFYDLPFRDTSDFHQEMIEKWLPKIKKGGLFIGRNFRDVRLALYKNGFKESAIMKCTIGNRISERLEYIKIR